MVQKILPKAFSPKLYKNASKMNKNILITGGFGFIGIRLIQRLLCNDQTKKIWVLDNLDKNVHGVDPKIPNLGSRVEFVRGDIADKSIVKSVVNEASPDIIYHLASETGTGQSYSEISSYCNSNVVGTANLIECIRHIANCKAFVLASSRAVYGEGAYADLNGNNFYPEPRSLHKLVNKDYEIEVAGIDGQTLSPVGSSNSLNPRPSSIYGSTKLMQELLVQQGLLGTNCRATIFRLQNVYGAGQSLKNPYTGILSIFSQQLLSGKVISVYEDGKMLRDFIHVNDVIDALVSVLRVDFVHGDVFDIGSGSPVCLLDVVRELIQLAGKNQDSFRITGEFRLGDVRHAFANISKTKKTIAWSPKINLNDGLKELLSWAQSRN